jgi:hypothetical protein
MPIFVNSHEISDEEVFAEMQYHPAPSANEARELAALALTIKQLLLQEAKAQAISAPSNNSDPDIVEEFLINSLLEQEILPHTASEIECERYYKNNPRLFRDNSGNVAPFASVRESIAEYLQDCNQQKAMQQYIKILAGKAKLAGIKLDHATSPLVN